MIKILAKTFVIASLFTGILAWGAGAFTVQPVVQNHGSVYSQVIPHQDPTSGLMIEPSVDPREFDKMDLAAKYALQNAYIHSNVVEYGGVIYLHKGQYRFGYPVTDKSVSSVWIPEQIYNGWEIVATYHTHPCMPYSHIPQYFSMPDTANAIYDSVPYYMGNLCKGTVNKFDPAVDMPDNVTLKYGMKLTTGRIVGNFYLYKTPIIVEENIDGVEDQSPKSY